MAAGLEVTDVQISEPRLLDPDVERGEQPSVVDISVVVRNLTTEKTLHAISDLRFLRYDPPTKTLFVSLRVPEPDPEIPTIHTFPPEVTPILPGETKALEVTVPVVIKDIQPSDQLAPNIVTHDISELEHVTSRVSYDETPFNATPTETGVEMVERIMQEWGETVEETFDRTLPSRQTPPSRREQSTE